MMQQQQGGIPFPPSNNIPGKNLLWSASASTTPTISPASYSPSDSGQELPMMPRRAHPSYRHSIATTVGLPIAWNNGSSGTSSTMTTVKRISSTSRALSLTGSTSLSGSINGITMSPESPAGLSDSTNVVIGSGRSPATPPAKAFSKWEKQELEARAIMKVREANRRKEAEKEKEREKERDKERERERLEKAEKER